MIARTAIRSVARPGRTAATRAAAVRFYTEDQFGRKEKAHEDQYVRAHEKEQLKKLREQLAKSKAQTAEIEKEIKERESKSQ